MLPLIGDRVVVRAMAERDLDAFVAYRRDPDVARYQSWTPDYDRAQAESLLAELAALDAMDPEPGAVAPPAGEWRQLAIADRHDDRLLGDAAVHTLADQPHTYELGVTLAPTSQGQGFAHDALALVLDALFGAAGEAHRVIAHADDRNHAVHHLVERLGFRLEARLVDADWCKGEWTTLRTYAVLSAEWGGSARSRS